MQSLIEHYKSGVFSTLWSPTETPTYQAMYIPTLTPLHLVNCLEKNTSQRRFVKLMIRDRDGAHSCVLRALSRTIVFGVSDSSNWEILRSTKIWWMDYLLSALGDSQGPFCRGLRMWLDGWMCRHGLNVCVQLFFRHELRGMSAKLHPDIFRSLWFAYENCVFVSQSTTR